MTQPWMFDVAQSAAAAVTLAKDGITAFQALRTFGAQHAARREARDSFMRAVGMSASGVSSYWISNDHPAVAADEPPYADLDALSTLLGQDIMGALAESNFPQSMREPTAALENDLILIGSPESEAMTRLFFGYEPSPDGRGVRRTRLSLPLVYQWNEERQAGHTTLCLHIRPGGNIAARPNWPLCWMEDGDLQMKRVRLQEGYLAEDYLLITVLPNFASDQALESGARIASFAGLHSIGTRAVRTLFDRAHASVLAELIERIESLPPKSQGLQAVVHVNEVAHDDLERGSQPISIRIHDVLPLSFTEDSLQTARDELQVALPKWKEDLVGQKVDPGAVRHVGFDLTRPFGPKDQRLVNLVAMHQAVDIDTDRSGPEGSSRIT